MKSSLDLWNILHDGSVVETVGECPGTVSFKLEIAYLCNMLAKGRSFLWVHLRDCTLAQFTPFDSVEPVADFSGLTPPDLTILSATEHEGRLSVVCVGGELHLAYSDARLTLDGGAPLEYAALERACETYWSEWERNNKRGV